MAARSGVSMLKSKCPDCMTRTNYPTIGCKHCRAEYHLICLGIVSNPPVDLEVFYCQNCEMKHGLRSIVKSDHLAFLKDLSEDPERNGSKQFIEAFKNKQFLSAEDIPLIKLPGKDVNLEYVEAYGFQDPIFVSSPTGLGLKLPSQNFTLDDLVQLAGPLKEIVVIDVASQKEQFMYVRELVEYFQNPERSKVINMLSLEFSTTRLGDQVEPPGLVRQMSWVSCFWRFLANHPMPEVQKYCLLSMAGSYTDFHIDFSGSSVWYHVVKGEKKFYLVRPTSENLEKFKDWMKDVKQPYKYFGDYVDQCYEMNIKEGETVFIPSGWIHAVLTPVDSLVFGGNFLNSFNVVTQLKVYNLEESLSTTSRYTFPSFEPLNWLVASSICSEVLGKDRRPVKKYLLETLKCLRPHLLVWSRNVENPPPQEVSHSELLKEVEAIVEAKWEEIGDGGTGVVYCKVLTDFVPVKRKKRKYVNAFIRS